MKRKDLEEAVAQWPANISADHAFVVGHETTLGDQCLSHKQCVINRLASWAPDQETSFSYEVREAGYLHILPEQSKETLQIYVDKDQQPLTKAQFDLVEPLFVKMMNRELTREKAKSEIYKTLNEAGLPVLDSNSNQVLK